MRRAPEDARGPNFCDAMVLSAQRLLWVLALPLAASEVITTVRLLFHNTWIETTNQGVNIWLENLSKPTKSFQGKSTIAAKCDLLI